MEMSEFARIGTEYDSCPQCKSSDGLRPHRLKHSSIFHRSCECGYKLIVEQRIICIATMTRRKNGKIEGLWEVYVPGIGHKYLSLEDIKERAGVRSVNQKLKIEDYLNSVVGRQYVVDAPDGRDLFEAYKNDMIKKETKSRWKQ